MLVPKKNKKEICQYLFKEGVLVAKKDFYLPVHPDIPVPNLQVIKVMQSLESRGYVKSQFSWQYFYYYLTDEGIQYLRDYLHLPADIVPATFKKSARPMTRPSFGGREERNSGEEYRKRPVSDEKKETAPGGFKPEFRGGVGRGRRD